MGAGQGFERGVQNLSSNLMQGIGLMLKQQRNEQLDKQGEMMMEARDAWQRGIEGRPPRYQEEEEEAARAAAMRPEIPSSLPTATPGPLGIPQTRFDTGKPVHPMPAAVPKPAGGAMGLLPSSMRTPSFGSIVGPQRADRMSGHHR
ncbi:MAG TPA: hypothetical protein VLM19_00420 [Nitrospiraceae bacterium]|nr:hypothetical protein [Nitrospiraceae bacterium]